MSDFLNMGGYAPFVWSSYAITALVVLVACVMTMRAARSARARLSALEEDARSAAPAARRLEDTPA